MEVENLLVSITLTFTGYPVGNPHLKIGFLTMYLGVPEPSAPMIICQFVELPRQQLNRLLVDMNASLSDRNSSFFIFTVNSPIRAQCAQA